MSRSDTLRVVLVALVLAQILEPPRAAASEPAATLTEPGSQVLPHGALCPGRGQAPDDTRKRVEAMVAIDRFRRRIVGRIVRDERDLNEILHLVLPREGIELRLMQAIPRVERTTYLYRQWIGDVSTHYVIRFMVDSQTREVVDASGIVLNKPCVRAVTRLTSRQVTSTVLDYLRAGGERARSLSVDTGGVHEAIKILRNDEVWWIVGIELEGEIAPEASREWFLVDLDGRVQPWQMGGDS